MLVLLPLSMKRDMSAFRYVSIASILGLFYTGLVMGIDLPGYYQENIKTAEKAAFYFDMNMFTGCSMTFFAFQCQVQLLPIYSELVNPEYRRVKKVVERAIGVDFFFYFTIAIIGYFSTFDKTATIVLERPPIPGRGTDYPILIAIMSIIVCVLVAFPMAYSPFRQQFFIIFAKRENGEFSNKENTFLTLAFVGISCLISIIFPKIDKVIAIMGGLCAVTMDFLIPVFCYVKLSGKPWTSCKNLSAILFFTPLVLIGYTSVVITIYLAATGGDTMPRYIKSSF